MSYTPKSFMADNKSSYVPKSFESDTPKKPEPFADFDPFFIERKERPGVWGIMQQMEGLVTGNKNVSNYVPLDVKYDIGKVVGMSSNPEEMKDRIDSSMYYSLELSKPLKVAYGMNNSINKVLFGPQSTPSSAWGRIKERYRGGKASVQLMDLGHDILKGTWKDWDKYEDNLKKIKELQGKVPNDVRKDFRNFWEKAAGAAADQLPILAETMKAAPAPAAAGGLIGGIIGGIAGIAVPTVGEEPATIGAGMATGVKVGAGLGGVVRMSQLEAGGMFLEIAEMEDEFGNKIDPKIAVIASHAVGAINGGIEIGQWSVLLSTFGIGTGLFKKSIAKVTSKFAAEGTLKNIVAQGLMKYGTAVAAETFQEIEQETTNVVFGELAKELNNARKGTDFKPITAEDLKARYTDVTIESLRAFGVIALPGTMISTAVDAVKAKGTAVVKPEAKTTKTVKAPEKTDVAQPLPPLLGAEGITVTKETPTETGTETPKSKFDQLSSEMEKHEVGSPEWRKLAAQRDYAELIGKEIERRGRLQAENARLKELVKIKSEMEKHEVGSPEWRKLAAQRDFAALDMQTREQAPTKKGGWITAPKDATVEKAQKEMIRVPVEDINSFDELRNNVTDFNKNRTSQKRKSEIIERSKELRRELGRKGYSPEFIKAVEMEDIGIPFPPTSPAAEKGEGKVTLTDKSVRDHPQQVIISGDTIEVRSKVGTKLAGKYTIPLEEWNKTQKHPNPAWAQAELIRKYTSGLDEQRGGPGQAQRIRDSQVNAINKAMAKPAPAAKKEVPMPDEASGGESPVSSIFRAVDKAKKLAPEVIERQHRELSKRVGKAAGMAQSKKGKSETAIFASTGALKGELTEYKLFESVRDKFPPPVIDKAFESIQDSKKLDYFGKLDTADAFRKLIDGYALTLREAGLIERHFGRKAGKAAMKHVPWGDKIWKTIIEALNIPRTMLASFDQSGILRQGRALGQIEPALYAKMVKQYTKAFWSNNAAEKIEAEMMQDPFYKEAIEDARFDTNKGKMTRKATGKGLEMVTWGKTTAEGIERAERFIGAGLLERVPGLRVPIIASERSFVTALNAFRMAVYSKIRTMQTQAGEVVPLSERLKIAARINDLTGRSNLSRSAAMKSIAPLMSALFSPRFTISRIKPVITLPTDAIMSIKNAKLRQELRLNAGAMTSLIATNLAIMFLLKLGDDDDELKMDFDLRSTDGGKIRHKNTHIDLWAGYLQPAQMMIQLAAGQRKSQNGTIYDADRTAILERFGRSKANPIMGFMLDAWTGRNFYGEKFGAPPKGATGEEMTAIGIPSWLQGVSKETWNRMTPLVIQDTIDALIEEGIPGAITAGTLSFYGAGTSTYPPYIKKRKMSRIRR